MKVYDTMKLLFHRDQTLGDKWFRRFYAFKKKYFRLILIIVRIFFNLKIIKASPAVKLFCLECEFSYIIKYFTRQYTYFSFNGTYLTYTQILENTYMQFILLHTHQSYMFGCFYDQITDKVKEKKEKHD